MSIGDISQDIKLGIKGTYTHLIRISLDKIAVLDFDTLMNSMISLHFTASFGDPSKRMVLTDKLFMYRQLWKAIIESLYDDFFAVNSI